MTQSPRELIMSHFRNDRGVKVGAAYMFETTRKTAVLRLTGAIEQLGGQVISVNASARPIEGTRRTVSTVYTVIAILPENSF